MTTSSKPMRCQQCQNEIAPGDKFCPECGAAVAELHPTQGVEAIFYPSDVDKLAASLAQTCKDEGIDITPGALTLLADADEGFQGYAERLLEQVASSYPAPLTEEHARHMLQSEYTSRAAALEKLRQHEREEEDRKALKGLAPSQPAVLNCGSVVV